MGLSSFLSAMPVRFGCMALAMSLIASCAQPTAAVPPVSVRSPRLHLASVARWLCYYGDNRGVLTLPGYSLMFLDGDTLGPVSHQDKAGRLCLAYLSLGEVDHFRAYWKDVQDKSWVLHKNPDWPEGRLVDPRSAEWRELIVKREAVRLKAMGYDGFLLDTLDTADTLMAKNRLKYAGAGEAMVRIVAELREAFPDAVIVANGGLSLMPKLAPLVDGMMYEGCRSTYDFSSKKYRDLTSKEIAWLDPRLAAIRKQGLPVFALDYVDPANAAHAGEIADTLRKAGYLPFVSVLHLNTYPGEPRKP